MSGTVLGQVRVARDTGSIADSLGCRRTVNDLLGIVAIGLDGLGKSYSELNYLSSLRHCRFIQQCAARCRLQAGISSCLHGM